uniref:Uncharacterized protein n=1 Tax=Paramoeba aestuarina TaxID=180227 RepID=A0A7S4KG89_9EUKA
MYEPGFSRHLIMDNGKAISQVHPDCILRGPSVLRPQGPKSKRRQTVDKLRNFAAAFRMDNITDESARTMVNANFRGRVARDERAVFSWLDGTKMPVDYIYAHNTIIREEFVELFEETGLDAENVLVEPRLALPTADSSIDVIKKYNKQALECAKNLLKYECIRMRPASNSMRVAPADY